MLDGASYVASASGAPSGCSNCGIQWLLKSVRADLAAAGFDIDSATLPTATSADEAPPRWPTTAHTPGIPIWHNMTLEQKRAFVASMGEDPDQIPTLETFEFGSLQWNEYASSLVVRLLTEAMQDNRLTVDGLEWGFSEEYTCTPDRLMDDQAELSGYYLQISGGRISGGAGVPPSCLALEFPGVSSARVSTQSFHGHCMPTPRSTASTRGPGRQQDAPRTEPPSRQPCGMHSATSEAIIHRRTATRWQALCGQTVFVARSCDDQSAHSLLWLMCESQSGHRGCCGLRSWKACRRLSGAFRSCRL